MKKRFGARYKIFIFAEQCVSFGVNESYIRKLYVISFFLFSLIGKLLDGSVPGATSNGIKFQVLLK